MSEVRSHGHRQRFYRVGTLHTPTKGEVLGQRLLRGARLWNRDSDGNLGQPLLCRRSPARRNNCIGYHHCTGHLDISDACGFETGDRAVMCSNERSKLSRPSKSERTTTRALMTTVLRNRRLRCSHNCQEHESRPKLVAGVVVVGIEPARHLPPIVNGEVSAGREFCDSVGLLC